MSIARSIASSIARPIASSVVAAGGGSSFSYLLDDLTGFFSLSSKRKLSASQTSWARVRNSSNEETDIGFSGQWIDAATLIDFADGGDLFVKTLYDPSGSDNHLTQSTTTQQPKILSTGSPILTEYTAGLSFDGTNDILSTTSNIAWGSTVTAILAGHTFAGINRSVFTSGSITDGSQQMFFVGTVAAGGYARVGTVDSGPAYDLYDLTAVFSRAGIGVQCNPVATPILNNSISATGFTRPFTSAASGAFTSTPLRLGGDSRNDFYSTLKCGGYAVRNAVCTSDELIAINKSIGSAASGVMIGDSTVAAYSGASEVASFVFSGTDFFRSHGIKSIAVAGHTIAQQKTVWSALTTRSLSEWVSVQIGLNDVNPATPTATTIAAIQDLIDTIRTDNPTCKIVGMTMIPAYERWPAVGFDSALAQAKWVAMNDAIMGRGGSPITGLDKRVESHTTELSKDVSGNAALADAYDTGDHIHPNNAGRTINGSALRSAVASLGFL